jgi:DNA-binding transcriptional MerR regulator
MPYKEKPIQKLYYSIGEVANMFDVNASLIRFWEKEFNSFLKPSKNKKGNRFYTPDDIEVLKLIYKLVKEEGFTLHGAKERITKEKKMGINTHTNTQALIEEKLLKIKEALEKLKNDL